MRIECPRCAARYEVADRLIGPAGKSVRCAKCGAVWLAGGSAARVPEPPPQWPEPPQRPAVSQTSPAPLEPREDPALAEFRAAQSAKDAAEAARPPSRPRSLMPAAILGWVATVAVLGAAAWGAYAHREAVIEAWPPSERVYLALGLRR